MAKKTNRFNVRNFEENRITIEEERKYRSSLALFFIKNGKLIFAISFLFSITVFIIAFYFIVMNLGESSIVMYESNGVKVSFNNSDNSILNGTPITDEYAKKVFDSVVSLDSSSGVVIKVDSFIIKNSKGEENATIIYYSDGTALIKYNEGGYTRVLSVDGNYGIDKNGVINSNAITKDLNGMLEVNKSLGITLLYLSDGSIEVTNGDTTFFVRNSDITNTRELFYTNLSGVSLPVNKNNNITYYSDGTIKENNGIIVDSKKYEIVEEKSIYSNIQIIYYEHGYAEVIKDNLSIMVKNKEHIVYDENSLEIIENVVQGIEIKDIMDIKEIKLDNTNTTDSHYIIVLEETDNYAKYDVNNILDNELIHYNIYINGNKFYSNIVNNNLKDSSDLEGISFDNDTYLLYEGTLKEFSSTTVKLGLWIDYEKITNQYMDSAFIGTVKVYVESLN